jgi:hypothetical protein
MAEGSEAKRLKDWTLPNVSKLESIHLCYCSLSLCFAINLTFKSCCFKAPVSTMDNPLCSLKCENFFLKFKVIMVVVMKALPQPSSFIDIKKQE